MSIIMDMDFGSDAESRHATEAVRYQNGQVNGIAGNLAVAFCSILRENGFSAGKFRKIIVELRRKYEIHPINGNGIVFEEMLDVFRYNIVFDFDRYLSMSRRKRGKTLLDILYPAVLDICEHLGLQKEIVDESYAIILNDNFVYEYSIGKAVQRKKTNLEARLVSMISPIIPESMIGAEVYEKSTGDFFGSCIFYRNIRLCTFRGKLKWVADDTLLLVPDDVKLVQVEQKINRGVGVSDELRSKANEVL
jgi:hypothetical protein